MWSVKGQEKMVKKMFVKRKIVEKIFIELNFGQNRFLKNLEPKKQLEKFLPCQKIKLG